MAYNGGGDGAVSSEATGTPIPRPSFSVTDVGANSATVTLNSYSGTWYLRLSTIGFNTCTAQSGNTPAQLSACGLQPHTR